MFEEKSKWDDAWEHADDTGIYTMDQCCEIADAADPDHDYGNSNDSNDSDDSNDSNDSDDSDDSDNSND